MKHERWQQIDAILQSAMDQPPDELDEFLRKACGQDENLEREVRSLLSVEQRAGGFLQGRAIGLGSESPAEPATSGTGTAGFTNGSSVSHFRIVEKLGGGG